MIYCKDIGIYPQNNKIEICYLDENKTFKSLNGKVINKNQVTLLSDLFHIETSFNNGHLCETIEPVKDEKSNILNLVRTQKALGVLKQISEYHQDVYWVTEDEGYATATVKPDKKISLSKLTTVQNAIQKYELNREINCQSLGLTLKNGKVEFCSLETPVHSLQTKVFSLETNEELSRKDVISVFDWFNHSKDGAKFCNPELKDTIKSKKSWEELSKLRTFANGENPRKISSKTLIKEQAIINQLEKENAKQNQANLQF